MKHAQGVTCPDENNRTSLSNVWKVWKVSRATHLVTVDRAVDAGVEVGDLVVREPALVHIVGGDVGGAEVDVGFARISSANP